MERNELNPVLDERSPAKAGVSREHGNGRNWADDPVQRQAIGAILDVIRGGERFLVCSHSRPDGDAVGSMLAMGMILTQMGKRADMVTADRIPNV